MSVLRMKELVSKQPVGVAMYSNHHCLSGYSSGTIMPHHCKCQSSDGEVNHAVTIIGYGKSELEECEDYWLVKNSWGDDWGEDGTFKLCADESRWNDGEGTCQVQTYVMWPTAD